MKINRIIVLSLILSMLLVNSTIVYAEESDENFIETTEISEEIIIENDTHMMSSINIDASDFKGQIKPATNEYYDGDGLFQIDKFATHYFFNLKENYGNNTHGSCGYVAAAMLLSYYDTFLNDSIIGENFDVLGRLASLDLSDYYNISPGINREDNGLCDSIEFEEDEEIVETLDDLNSNYYWDVITRNWEEYFHLYLIKLAEEEFNMYHDEIVILEECGLKIEINTETPCASLLLHQKSLIEYYLYEVRNYTENEVSLEYTNVNVRNFAINKIKNGQPVILLLGSPTGFHFVVAYDLNDNSTEDTSDDEIYAHYGNFLDKTHINIDTDKYPWLVSALAINFNIEHSCSYNYTYNGEAYCSCFLMCNPDHEYHYTFFNSLYHIGECIHCGHETNQLSHMWEDYSARYWSCRDCGHLKAKETGDKFPIIHNKIPDQEGETE